MSFITLNNIIEEMDNDDSDLNNSDDDEKEKSQFQFEEYTGSKGCTK